jgi:ribosomal protein S18 acetylase RimI-like enzyme
VIARRGDHPRGSNVNVSYAGRLVIVADAGYHALGLYESLGFERRERVHTVCRPPSI